MSFALFWYKILILMARGRWLAFIRISKVQVKLCSLKLHKLIVVLGFVVAISASFYVQTLGLCRLLRVDWGMNLLDCYLLQLVFDVLRIERTKRFDYLFRSPVILNLRGSRCLYAFIDWGRSVAHHCWILVNCGDKNLRLDNFVKCNNRWFLRWIVIHLLSFVYK